jgi:hypothetical protein
VSDEERIKLPDGCNAVDYLTSLGNAVELDRPPELFTDVPDDKALIWVVDNGPDRGGQLAYYVSGEARFRDMLRSSPGSQDEAEAQHSEDRAGSPDAVVLGGDYRPFTWLLMDREAADLLVPEAARDRAEWAEHIAHEAENAVHPDNLLPVARIYRLGMKNDAEALLSWAAALRRQPSAGKWAELLDDEHIQRIAATDLEVIGRRLERLSAADWVAVIDPPWETDGPLPPWPDRPVET